jgi:hypothetical protein
VPSLNVKKDGWMRFVEDNLKGDNINILNIIFRMPGDASVRDQPAKCHNLAE